MGDRVKAASALRRALRQRCCLRAPVRARLSTTSRSRAWAASRITSSEFTALAKDLDKIFKASGSDVHVYTLTGNDATRAHLTETLKQVAQRSQAGRRFRPHPDRPRLLRRRRVQVQSARSRHFRRGPRRPLRSRTRQAPVDRQHDQRQRRLDGRAREARARRDHRHQNRHREKRHRVRPLLGGGAARSGQPMWTRTMRSARSKPFEYADRKTAAFYESQKRLATEHAVFEDTGKNDPVRAHRPIAERACCFRASR